MDFSEQPEADSPLQGARVALVGKFASMSRREAQRLIREAGGTPVETASAGATLVVVGEERLPLGNGEQDEHSLDPQVCQAAERGELSIIGESQLWERMGLVESEPHVRRLYTPAMLAGLLGVSLSVVRRWHRKGLIVPVREVRRLPYFDFQEVATARRLAELLAAGCSPAEMERRLAELARYLPGVQRPLAQLSVIVQGKQILLRQGEGLVEPGGQLRLDFDPPEHGEDQLDSANGNRNVLSLASSDDQATDIEPVELLRWAVDLEDRGHLAEATEMYRVALAAQEPRAEVNFALAELLYRRGDLGAARERYYMAIELDENYVEARANLGCVLAETGEWELAVAAFQGALAYHEDYPDVHYHLARTLDELGRSEEAERHWQAFLHLAPSSPWADEARARLAAC